MFRLLLSESSSNRTQVHSLYPRVASDRTKLPRSRLFQSRGQWQFSPLSQWENTVTFLVLKPVTSSPSSLLALRSPGEASTKPSFLKLGAWEVIRTRKRSRALSCSSELPRVPDETEFPSRALLPDVIFWGKKSLYFSYGRDPT
jgi:hypothetical protein